MNERLKTLRKSLGLTQAEFAEKIGTKQTTIGNYEIGRNKPIDPVVRMICRTFDVSETWLRTGEGEMFIKLSRDEQIADFVGKALSGKAEDEFKRRLVSALSKLSEDAWKALEEICDRLAEEYKE